MECCRGDGKEGQKLRWSLQRIEIVAAGVVLVLLLVWLGSVGVWSGRGDDTKIQEVKEEVVRGQIPKQLDMTRGLLGGTEKEYLYYTGRGEGVKKEPEEIVVAIDAGHGGADDGCVRKGVKEKEVNLDIAKKVQSKLQTMGYQVVLVREEDEFMTLSKRVKVAKKAHADVYVSIHQNSSDVWKARGVEAYYSGQFAKEDSQRLAQLLHEQVLSNTGANKRSIYEWEEFHVIRESVMPSCLIETGFLTNASERQRLADASYQEKIADGIASGIDLYFHPETE